LPSHRPVAASCRILTGDAGFCRWCGERSMTSSPVSSLFAKAISPAGAGTSEISVATQRGHGRLPMRFRAPRCRLGHAARVPTPTSGAAPPGAVRRGVLSPADAVREHCRAEAAPTQSTISRQLIKSGDNWPFCPLGRRWIGVWEWASHAFPAVTRSRLKRVQNKVGTF